MHLLEHPNVHFVRQPFQGPLETTIRILYRSLIRLEERMKAPAQPSLLPPEAYHSLKLHAGVRGEEITSTKCCQEREEWHTRIAIHRQHASTIRQFLRLLVANKHTCANFLAISRKYNLTNRLWELSFYTNLDALRYASSYSSVAFELLADCLTEANTFYTELLQDSILSPFRVAWLEALGDLGRYNLVVLAMLAERVEGTVPFSRGRRLDEEATAWKTTAERWYSLALELDPGSGKLQHHLGLLYRHDEAQVLRSLYHFATSVIAPCPFQESHLSILGIWSAFAQEQRRRDVMGASPGRATEGFVLLQGMIFQSKNLADFSVTISRFLERLEEEVVGEADWALMAVINVSCILDYGRSGNNSLNEICWPTLTPGQPDTGLTLTEPGRQSSLLCSMQITCSMLALAIRKQLSSSPLCLNLNPHIIIILTFLCALTRYPNVISAFCSYIPWYELHLLESVSPARLPGVQLCCLPQSASLREDYFMRGVLLAAGRDDDCQRWVRVHTAMTHLNHFRRDMAEEDTVSVEGAMLDNQPHTTSNPAAKLGAQSQRNSTTFRSRPCGDLPSRSVGMRAPCTSISLELVGLPVAVAAIDIMNRYRNMRFRRYV